jgi:high-affinity Fe2+/Pb2+ permease
MKYSDGIILVFFLVKISNQWSKNKMGITELIVIAFLAVLGFLAYNNSKKVARELRRLGADK